MSGLQAIRGRIKSSSFEIAVVRSGKGRVEQVTLKKSPVMTERSWGRRVLGMTSNLLRHA